MGWGAFKWQVRTQYCSRAIQPMSTAGVECDGHFIEALKWAGWRSSATWCSHPAQARVEVQKSAWWHFSEAMKWAGAHSKWQVRTQVCSRAIKPMSTAGVERDGHFIEALKWKSQSS